MAPFDLAWHPRPNFVLDVFCFPFLFTNLLVKDDVNFSAAPSGMVHVWLMSWKSKFFTSRKGPCMRKKKSATQLLFLNREVAEKNVS